MGATAASAEMRALTRNVAAFRRHGHMDMAFGGPVFARADGMQVTEVSGARTTAVNSLFVRTGAGIGGKALAFKRPVSVSSYLGARGITHVYDHAVIPESLETVAVLPVLVDDRTRMLIYLCSRLQVALGDRWFDSFAPLLQRVERDLLVEEEVRRQMARLTIDMESGSRLPASHTRDRLRELEHDLDELRRDVADEQLRGRIDAVWTRLAAAIEPGAATSATPVELSPRELDVLHHIALGLSNAAIADALGLLPNTVKTYVKTAMRKLNANNRVHATVLARQAGLLS